MLVWVVDPQKYADAVLHADFIAPHARHGAVTIVVLNQVDLLPAVDVPRVVESLRGLLADDGLRGVRILPTSATTGEGVDALRAAIGTLAEDRLAQAARLAADVTSLASAVPQPGSVARAGKSDTKARARELTERLGDAAGVDVVAGAVAASHRKRSAQATGWPLIAWILRLRGRPPHPARPATHEGRRARPRPAPLEHAAHECGGAGEGVARGAQLRRRRLGGSHRAVAGGRAGRGTACRGRAATAARPRDHARGVPTKGAWWWVIFAILQWVALAAALAGVLWLLGIAFVPPLAPLLSPVPQVEGWPLTTLLIVGGVLLGILLGVLGAAIGGADRRASAATGAQGSAGPGRDRREGAGRRPDRRGTRTVSSLRRGARHSEEPIMSARFEELDYQQTPMGDLTLRRRREPTLDVDVYEVKLGEEYLMSSLFTVAEEELARLGLAAVQGNALDVVVGGLGLGYTAVAALEDARVASLVVIDALPAVIEWHERGLLPGLTHADGRPANQAGARRLLRGDARRAGG